MNSSNKLHLLILLHHFFQNHCICNHIEDDFLQDVQTISPIVEEHRTTRRSSAVILLFTHLHGQTHTLTNIHILWLLFFCFRQWPTPTYATITSNESVLHAPSALVPFFLEAYCRGTNGRTPWPLHACSLGKHLFSVSQVSSST
jgi:hypothetical protein